MWGYPRGFAYYKSPEKDFRTKQSKKFREEHGTITRRYIYGSTTQYAGNDASRMLGVTTSAQSKATEKLSSGYRINRAAGDAAD